MTKLFKRLKEYRAVFKEDETLLKKIDNAPTFKDIRAYFFAENQMMSIKKTDEFKNVYLFIQKLKNNGFSVQKNERQFIFSKSKKYKNATITILSQIDMLSGKENNLSTVFQYKSPDEDFHFEDFNEVYFINKYLPLKVDDVILTTFVKNFNCMGIQIKENEYSFCFVDREKNIAGNIQVFMKEKMFHVVNFKDIDFNIQQKYDCIENCVEEIKNMIELHYAY